MISNAKAKKNSISSRYCASTCLSFVTSNSRASSAAGGEWPYTPSSSQWEKNVSHLSHLRLVKALELGSMKLISGASTPQKANPEIPDGLDANGVTIVNLLGVYCRWWHLQSAASRASSQLSTSVSWTSPSYRPNLPVSTHFMLNNDQKSSASRLSTYS